MLSVTVLHKTVLRTIKNLKLVASELCTCLFFHGVEVLLKAYCKV